MTPDAWPHVTLPLPVTAEELPADPRKIDAPGWVRWATDGFPDDGEPGDFSWMAGLVPAETVALSNAYLAATREEAPPADEPGLPGILGEVAQLLRDLRRLPVEVRVLATVTPTALAFVCRSRSPVTRVETDRLYERLRRWTGMRVDGCDVSHSGRVELVGDSYATMDWGLHQAKILEYEAQPVFVFVAGDSWGAADALVAGIDVRPSADHPLPPPAATAPIAEPDAPPPAALAELTDAWLAVEPPGFVAGLFLDIGPARTFLEQQGGAWRYGRRGEAEHPGPGALAAAIADWRTLAREHGAPDLRAVQLHTGNLKRAADLELYGAAIRTVAATCGIDLTPPAGHAVRPSPWALSIHPATLAVAKVDPFAPIGGLLLDKRKEPTKVTTTYWLVTDHGLQRLKDKRAAGSQVAAWVVAHAKRTGALPPHTTIDGTAATFSASKYDVFPFQLSAALVGSDPATFVAGLGAAPPDAPDALPPADEDRAPWRVELAKSGRSTCRACGRAIDHGAVRVGSPSEFEGRASWRWHHLACGAPRLRTPEKLSGFADLPPEEAERVRVALRG